MNSGIFIVTWIYFYTACHSNFNDPTRHAQAQFKRGTFHTRNSLRIEQEPLFELISIDGLTVGRIVKSYILELGLQHMNNKFIVSLIVPPITSSLLIDKKNRKM